MFDLIHATKGRFCTVTFKKADGSARTINGRFGVKKHLKGGKATIDASRYYVIYSVQDKGYRCINKETIMTVVFNGLTVKVN